MHTIHAGRTGLAATLPMLALSLLLAGFGVKSAGAEAAPPADARPLARWELLTSSGAVVTTGAHHRALTNGALSTVQLSYVAAEPLAFTGTFGWARNRERLSGAGLRLDLFSYDLGVEARMRPRCEGRRFAWVPFVAAGSGARTYRHRDSGPAVAHALTAYAGAGTEVGSGRVRLRLEARDYLLDSEPLTRGDDGGFRNEVALLAGLRLVSR
ncbi:MAG: hypothetical protein U0704_15895 [Candidatus Eisenbacteria bacterium]